MSVYNIIPVLYISNIYIHIYVFVPVPSSYLWHTPGKKKTHTKMYFMIRDDPSDIGMAHLPSQIGVWFCLNLSQIGQSCTGWRFGDRNCLPVKTKDLTLRGWKICSFISLIDTYECMWFYECRVHLKKPSWTCSMVFLGGIQGGLSSNFNPKVSWR